MNWIGQCCNTEAILNASSFVIPAQLNSDIGPSSSRCIQGLKGRDNSGDLGLGSPSGSSHVTSSVDGKTAEHVSKIAMVAALIAMVVVLNVTG